MTKVPTRSPTHEEVDPGRMPGMGIELEDIAVDGIVPVKALIELAEDRGRPASHYVCAIPLATELKLEGADAKTVIRVCAGNCQRYGALDILDHLVGKHAIQPIECLDQCDHGPAIEIHSSAGKLVIAPASNAKIDEALTVLASG